MQVKKFNISKPRKYTDNQGVEKTQWNNIGTITEFHKEDGSVGRIIEIPAIGLEANIFPFQEKEPAPKQSTQDQNQGRDDVGYQNSQKENYPAEDINPADIPF